MAITPQIPTVAAPPGTNTIAQQGLASMAALSGVLTDYNIGSQIRTQMESVGAVGEIQGISAVALAFQTIAYSAMSLFGITPNGAIPSVGTATFTTALINPPPAIQSVIIPQGTLVQTTGGIQFSTTTTATLVSGATTINVPIQAVQGGSLGNVPPGAITQIISGLTYPLAATNPAATTGGINAETPAQALTRLSAVILSLIGGSPVSVANSVIGVQASGTNETVVYATCFEPWLAAPPGSPAAAMAGFSVYIDNGTGGASANLITAVTAKLNGNINTNTPAYRPSGVPYFVYADSPVLANVSITGSIMTNANLASVTNNINNAIISYFTLPFGMSAQQGAIAAVGSNAALGVLISYDAVLTYATDTTQTPVSDVVGALFQRVILNDLSVVLTQ